MKIYKVEYVFLDENEKIRIRNNMKKLHITTKEIAKDLNYSVSFVNMVIRGERMLDPRVERYLSCKGLL